MMPVPVMAAKLAAVAFCMSRRPAMSIINAMRGRDPYRHHAAVYDGGEQNVPQLNLLGKYERCQYRCHCSLADKGHENQILAI